MTESSPTTLFTPVTAPKSKTASVGVLVRNAKAKVVKIDTNDVCGPHESGELLIQAPQV